MICMRLSGGIGNQMFQYACGRALASKHKVKLILDLSFLENQSLQKIYIIRNYELGVFSNTAHIANEKELKKLKPSYFFRLFSNLKWFRGILMFLYPNILIESENVSYDERINKIKGKCLLIGYWQNELYFKNIKENLYNDFEFSRQLDVRNLARAKKITNSNSVGIHIRRGDYIENLRTNKFHGLCTLDYYKSAIRLVLTKVVDPVFFIFSDDLNWVKDNLNIPKSNEYIYGNTGNESYIDMQLMSLCKHNIIANSTFSWWAAWLNHNPNKIVIAPKQWYADSVWNEIKKDFIPAKWLKL